MNPEKRILHLGLGRFHRGHQAVYYQKMKDLGAEAWGVVSMSMRSPEARDQIRRVNLRYPVLELSGASATVNWIDSIQEALSAHEDFSRVMEIFQSPELEIVTLTITEKGYDLGGDGKLDLTKPHIARDLQNPEHPESAIGLLSLGLRMRRLANLPPVTVISCDNLRANGDKLQAAVETYVRQLAWNDDQLWVSNSVTFPNTMVDRIVPSLLPEKITDLEKEFSLPSSSELIGTEKFSQWVIEDKFAGKKPRWEKVGVQFVSDVKPFEEMKLKLLNASHSYLAYAGLNRGHQFVHEAIKDPELRSQVLRLYEEVSAILEIPQGFDLSQYKAALIERFENNKLPHQLKQIAMDGSQKLPQRIFSSLLETQNKNLSNASLVQVVKEWIQFCSKQFSSGLKLEDPESEYLRPILTSGDHDELWNGRIFTVLAGHEALKKKIF